MKNYQKYLDAALTHVGMTAGPNVSGAETKARFIEAFEVLWTFAPSMAKLRQVAGPWCYRIVDFGAGALSELSALSLLTEIEDKHQTNTAGREEEDGLQEEVEFLRFMVNKITPVLGPADSEVTRSIKEQWVKQGWELPKGYGLDE